VFSFQHYENNYLTFTIDGRTTKSALGNISAINYGQWNHVLCCLDGTLSGADRIRIYINGVDETYQVSIGTFTALQNASGGLMIGEEPQGAYNPYKGFLDEVAIWSGEDLRNDVATIYNNGTPTDLNNNGLTAPTTWQRFGDNGATWNGATWTMTDVNGGYVNRSINMVEANRTTDVPPNPFVNTKSILLDGVDDYVNCGNDSSLQFNNLLSVSAWVKTSTSGKGILAIRVGNTATQEAFSLTSSGEVRMNNGTRLTANTSILDNNWHHIVVTYNTSLATNNLKIYIDGSLDNSVNRTTVIQGSGTNYLIIGEYRASNFFNGILDEVSVFNSELSASDITSIYNGGVPNNISSLSPVSWWRFEGTGTTATDSGSGGNNGTLTNGVTRSTDVPTASSFTNTKSILLDGVDDYVDTSTNFGVPPIDRYNKDTFSVSVWIKIDASQTVNWQYYTPISATTNGGNVGLVTRKFGNATGHVVYSSPNNGTTQLDDGNWHHLLGVFIASTNNWRVFVDGNSTPEINQTIASWQFFDKNVKIGQQGNQTNYFVGNVDECAYWLSDESANLATIYNSGVPNDISSLSPLSWWRCGDGDTAPILTDNGSGGNDGTMTNFSTFSTDVPTFTNTKSILLDGVDDFVEIGSPTSIQNLTSAITISAWIKAPRTFATNYYTLASKGEYAGSGSQWSIRINTANVRNTAGGLFSVFPNSNGITDNQSLTFPTPVDDNQWHHMMFVNNGTDLKVYIDGVLDATGAGKGRTLYNGNRTLRLGRLTASTTQKLIGNLDEVAIFGTALGLSDAQSIYNGGVPNDISSLSPVSWWRCGDGDTSPTLTDNGSASNDGTMTNFTTFSTDVPT
jgi:hypothetical protein